MQGAHQNSIVASQGNENELRNAPFGLSDDVAAALRELVAAGTPKASLRAFRSDMSYLEAWHSLAFNGPLTWPASEQEVITFLVHHMFDPAIRADNPSHGMPASIEKQLRAASYLRGRFPPTWSTIERRLMTWSKAHRIRNVEGVFSSPAVAEIRRRLINQFDTRQKRKSPQAVDQTIMQKMLATCGPDLVGLRDRALLMFMYASGGRRRSEPGAIRIEDISFTVVPSDPEDADSDKLLALCVSMARTKTTRAGAEVWAVGEPAEAVRAWIDAAMLTNGPLFPRLLRDRKAEGGWRADVLAGKGLAGDSVGKIVKRRASTAGIDPSGLSAHGIRAGFLTDAEQAKVPLAEAMQQSLHKSVAQAMSYYNRSAVMGGAARLMAGKPKDD